MDDAFILAHVDHTLLAATATWAEIERLCDEALTYSTASVCVPPCYVAPISKAFPSVNICTVVGFPLGYEVLSTKTATGRSAIEDGASELDMVINLADVKNGQFAAVGAEIAALKAVAGSRILKVIVETCYLTESEKIVLCGVVTDAGADYIKTSTGFGAAGATIDDVKLFKANIGVNVKIKAAGGIRTREDMISYLEAGCSRLGTSSAVKILTGGESQGY
ncbi:MAG: deoxyribose-phosphate aldolase [Oscillospiraceae bacterium]|nr:deoxyribose-phosphate aldolase [Oscillospiraceae bacterium]